MNNKPLALLIEDNYRLADIYSEVLTLAGYQVEVISDGLQASERLKTLVPYLVLLDLHLPSMNGDQIYSQIKQDPRLENVKLIIATADSAMVQTQDMEQGSDLILLKPISVEQLLPLVQRLLIDAA